MTRGRTAVLALVALAVLVPAAAGCGGDDDADQFRDDYNSVVNELQDVNADISSATASDPEKLAQQYDKIADHTAEAREKLADLDPPDEAKDELDDLVGAVGDGADHMRGVAEAARRGDEHARVDAANELSETGQKINEAEEELKKAVDG